MGVDYRDKNGNIEGRPRIHYEHGVCISLVAYMEHNETKQIDNIWPDKRVITNKAQQENEED